MSVRKKQKQVPFSRNVGLNHSIRTMNKKKRIHCQVHVALQDRLEKEIKIRDGATRLLGACTHETQLLEAAKTLHTSNARTLVYMSELQKLKATEVMEVVLDQHGYFDESKVCKGRIGISDIRIPLMWKDVFGSTHKSKESSRHAVFCVVTVGSEVQDTELVCVDRNTTDIAFTDIIVFENASYDFKMSVELFACPMSASSLSAPTPQKLMSRLNRSVVRGEGKRMREHMKENVINGVKSISPVYTKVASTDLLLCDVSDACKSHDLDRTNQHSLSLPLYENITCRLVAQPKCITDISLSGFLHYLHMVGAIPNWSYLWCEVKAGVMKGWKSPEESNKEPHFAIDLIPKDVKVNEIEKTRQRRSHSFQVRDLTERHMFAAGSNDELIKWIRGIRQHKSDHGAWGEACVSSPLKRAPLFIASPSHRQIPSELIFERGVRKTLIYDQLGIDSPLKALTQSVRCTDMLSPASPDADRLASQSVRDVLLENQTTAPWTGFFTGLNSKPAKITKTTDIQRNYSSEAILQNHSYNLRPLKSSPERTTKDLSLSHSEVSTSDDSALSDVENRAPPIPMKKSTTAGLAPSKKKRRAPTSPWDDSATKYPVGSPPLKPPLPKLPPKQKFAKRPSISSASSLDDILEDRTQGTTPATRLHDNALVDCEGNPRSKLTERSWANEKNCVIPASALKSSHCLVKSKSLDYDGLPEDKDLRVSASENTGGRSRTNTLPKSSPSRARLRKSPNKVSASKLGPAPRRSYLSAVESSKTKPSYETVKCGGAETSGSGLSYRRLLYDENAGVYCQAKPPALPPKKSKTESSSTTEPIYAEIDEVRKQACREAKARRGEDAYTKAHRAIITVCKQRMEEEASKTVPVDV